MDWCALPCFLFCLEVRKDFYAVELFCGAHGSGKSQGGVCSQEGRGGVFGRPSV